MCPGVAGVGDSLDLHRSHDGRAVNSRASCFAGRVARQVAGLPDGAVVIDAFGVRDRCIVRLDRPSDRSTKPLLEPIARDPQLLAEPHDRQTARTGCGLVFAGDVVRSCAPDASDPCRLFKGEEVRWGRQSRISRRSLHNNSCLSKSTFVTLQFENEHTNLDKYLSRHTRLHPQPHIV